MLRRITIILMMMACVVCSAQTTVSSIKYWVDSKFSEAKTMDMPQVSTMFDVDISNQAKGAHFFYVMPKDSEGNWGKLHRFMYFIPDTQTDSAATAINRFEYWFDGNFDSRETEKTDNTTLTMTKDIGAMTHGLHTFSYRAINNLGQYSPISSHAFYVSPEVNDASSVQSIEYWIDGGAKTEAKVEGNDIMLDSLDISSLRTGVHFFYVQPKDDLGKLGKLHRYMFLKAFSDTLTEATSISRVEYWIDNDYSGLKTMPTNETTFTIDVDLDNLPFGNHFFTYRVVNNLGEYSEMKRLMFFLGSGDEVAELKSYEYWIDDNYDKRVSGDVSGEKNDILIENIDLSSYGEGVHFFYVQMLNANDNYGKLHRYMFYIPKAADNESEAKMKLMEYWIDDDMENKQTIESENLQNVFDIPTNTMKYGMHSFYYRLQNSDGEWSSINKKLFYINDKDFTTVQPLVGYRYFINGNRTEGSIVSTTQFGNDINIAIPNTKLVPIELDSCKFQFETPKAGMLRMDRKVGYHFAIQFKNEAGEWNAPATTKFMVPDSAEVEVMDLELDKELTLAKPVNGVIKAFKFNVTKEDTYYLSAKQSCYIGIYMPDGTMRYSLSPVELKNGFGDYLEPGTYYGVVFNSVLDGDNPEENVTIRFNSASIKIGKLTTEVKDNVMFATCATEGVKIYYTMDGSDPTENSTLYTDEGIKLTENCRVQLVAVMDGMLNSSVEVVDVDYFTVADPVIRMDNMKVVISSATPDVTIYYTVDGSSPLLSSLKYTNPIALREDLTIMAVAKKNNYNTSNIVSETFLVKEYTCLPPSFMRDGDTIYVGSLTEGATIYYTVDGSEPSTRSLKAEDGKIVPTINGTIRAIAALEGRMYSSEVKEYVVNFIKAKKPEMTFDETTNVLTITTETEGARILYEIGGETPTEQSMEYYEPITLDDNRIVKAIAVTDYMNDSEVASFRPSTISCSDISIDYDGRSVKLTCNTRGSVIYYTTDGYNPSTSSAQYDGNAVVLEHGDVVKAIAVKENLKNASVAFTPPAYYNGGKTYVNQPGELATAYKWCGKDNVADVTVEGSINDTDLALIKTMTGVRHLDLSETEVEGQTLPEKTFEGMQLISFASPKNITEAGSGLLSGVKSIGAVVWNADIAVPEDLTGDVTPVNALLYVSSESLASSKFHNVVVNGEAENIILTDADDASNFFCPQEFVAKEISYKHTYTLMTEKGVLTGWEALALPFAPTAIVHSINGECVPFRAYDPSFGKKPFWLCEMTSSGFAPTDVIKANKGYIVCMPNNEDYGDEYILGGNGDITYKAEKVRVPVTASAYNDLPTMGEYTFWPNYMHLAQSDSVMVINKTNYGSNKPGSVFVPDQRPAYPFEAYVTQSLLSSGEAAPLRIDSDVSGLMDIMYDLGDVNKSVYSENGSLFIYSKGNGEVNIYKTNGVLYRTVKVQAGWNRFDDLNKDVYVVKGKKVVLN